VRRAHAWFFDWLTPNLEHYIDGNLTPAAAAELWYAVFSRLIAVTANILGYDWPVLERLQHDLNQVARSLCISLCDDITRYFTHGDSVASIHSRLTLAIAQLKPALPHLARRRHKDNNNNDYRRPPTLQVFPQIPDSAAAPTASNPASTATPTAAQPIYLRLAQNAADGAARPYRGRRRRGRHY
jgi:hypothetical protein